MSDQIVELGDEVKDLVTGFQGIAIRRTIFETAEDRFEVKPPLKDGEMKDSHVFDVSCLEVVEKQKVKFDPSKTPTTDIKIGDEVEDELTGFKGIAVATHVFLNQCLHISIQPPFDKKKFELPENRSFEYNTIKVLNKQKVKLNIKKEVKKKSERPGGPDKYTPTRGINISR